MRSALTVLRSKRSPSSSTSIAEISRKISNEAVRSIIAFCQEIRIARRTITLPCPKFEEEGAFQNKRIPVFRFAEPEEHPFKAVLREHESKVIVPLLRKVEKLCRIEAGRFLIFESGN